MIRNDFALGGSQVHGGLTFGTRNASIFIGFHGVACIRVAAQWTNDTVASIGSCEAAIDIHIAAQRFWNGSVNSIVAHSEIQQIPRSSKSLGNGTLQSIRRNIKPRQEWKFAKMSRDRAGKLIQLEMKNLQGLEFE